MVALIAALAPLSILIQGGTIIDGTGAPGFVGDLRIEGQRIVAIARHLEPSPDDLVVPARGLVVAPGFIDAHSHADRGIGDDPLAVSQVTQGITTAVVGQDGIWDKPVKESLAELQALRPAINFAAFSGHGGIRAKVMGDDYKRAATNAEIAEMTKLVQQDMKDGALGLSSGLEYDPGYYSDTKELVAMAKEVAPFGGLYISHMRDEGDRTFEAIAELRSIGLAAGIRSQISHIKLGTASVWGRANEAAAFTQDHLVSADVYPYTYWQSTIAALSPSRDWADRRIWVKALADVGGPGNIRLSKFSPDRSWEGKTIAEISKSTGKDAISVIQEVLERTRDGRGSQSVVVTAMQESDLEVFVKAPRIMFCSDGSIGGSHPRGAGTFPRIFAQFVRGKRLLTIQEAIRKMTSLTARTFGLRDRGELKPNAIADIAVFDPATIQDRATPADPKRLSQGMAFVFVGGRMVLKSGQPTGARPGVAILRNR
ncbi:MAG: amidohydrolase family protein [Armatimonadetes bacterium]|nr:amidohydrolase family protein [Armatimonadota bacterium]